VPKLQRKPHLAFRITISAQVRAMSTTTTCNLPQIFKALVGASVPSL